MSAIGDRVRAVKQRAAKRRESRRATRVERAQRKAESDRLRLEHTRGTGHGHPGGGGDGAMGGGGGM